MHIRSIFAAGAGCVFALAIASCASADNVYSDRASFTASTTSLMTVDFGTLAPPFDSSNPNTTGYAAFNPGPPYGSGTGITIDGVNVNTDYPSLFALAAGPDIYNGVSEGIASAQATQDPAAPSGLDFGTDMTITLPAGVTAVGFDYNTGGRLGVAPLFTLSDGTVFPGQEGNSSLFFIGFTSSSPITSVTIADPDDDSINIGELAFGGAANGTSTPLPKSSSAAFVLLGIIGAASLRRRAAASSL